MGVRSRCRRAIVVAALLFVPGAALAQDPILECPFAFSGGDLLFRGFYAPEYPSDNLDRVELLFATNFTDTYTISLTVREGTYDGPLVGVSTIELDLVAGEAMASEQNDAAAADIELGDIPTVLGVFDFGTAAVTPGGTVTFALEQLGGLGSAFYDVGPCPGKEPGCEGLCHGEIIQTNGTDPPLDSFRRASVGIRVFDAAPPDVPAVTGAAAVILVLLLLMIAASRAIHV